MKKYGIQYRKGLKPDPWNKMNLRKTIIIVIIINSSENKKKLFCFIEIVQK